jgi:hypothetical protein
MARDVSGTYTLPAGNPVVTATPIAISWANGTLNDVATALTDSLDRNGNGGMNVALKGFAGTVSAPGYSFSLETSLGMYRAGAGVLGFAVGGSQIANVTSAGMGILGTLDLGHASDTTIARGAPGVVTIEGATVPVNGVGQTWVTGLLEIGHATDTSLSRLSAGVLAVEGNAVPVQGTGQTWTTGVLELGHASDTTISRVSAGVIAVEGNTVPVMGTGQTWTTGAIELGHASDTTISRLSAGVVGVEGVAIATTLVPRRTSGFVTGECLAISAGVTLNTSDMATSRCFSIYNDSASPITITQGSGVTLRLSGTATTGNRTMAQRTSATIWCNSGTEAVMSGAGVT